MEDGDDTGGLAPDAILKAARDTHGLGAAEAAALAERIARAGRVVTVGRGHEGLILEGLAMSLRDLGVEAGPAGAVTTAPAGRGDLVLAAGGADALAGLRVVLRVAGATGAEIWVVTTEPHAPAQAGIEVHHLLGVAVGDAAAADAAFLTALFAFAQAVLMRLEAATARMSG